MRSGTYSIVARDRDSGELGVAVQSHWFAVGGVVSWARPGVGAAATQSVAEVAHGPGMLDRIAEGLDAREAIAAVLRADDLARFRQLGAVDASGRTAAHTGEGCIPHAGDVQGDGFSCQANMMRTATVPQAMASAYEGADVDLAARMLAALDAAEAQGGDVRGRQSAVLLVVPPEGESWRTRFHVRVDDSPEPVAELRRLLNLARAYELAERADAALAAGAREEATSLYMGATELAPQADELMFWAGLGVAGGDLAAGVELVRRAAAVKQSWLALLERLPEELEPNARVVREALRTTAEDG
jgi:uncharacterized Ntn-hydrolase superfamily protein